MAQDLKVKIIANVFPLKISFMIEGTKLYDICQKG